MMAFDLAYATEAAAISALAAVGISAVNGSGTAFIPQIATAPDGSRVDIIVAGGGTGIISRPTGATQPGPALPDGSAGPSVPVYAPLDGFFLTVIWNGANPPNFGNAVTTAFTSNVVTVPAPTNLGAALASAASSVCADISGQIVPDTTHQTAYQLAAAMVGASATVPTAPAIAAAFEAMAASFGFQSQAFATLVVAVSGAALQLSAILAAVEGVANNPASTPAQLAAALSTFETSIAAFVTSINSAGLAITVVAPPAVVIPGINA